MNTHHFNEDFSARSRIEDIGRWYVNQFVERTAASLAAGSMVLDAGAGEGVYKRYFGHCTYRAIDLAVGDDRWNYEHLDYVGPLHKMPIDSESFDAILCTQVLEHLEYPRESVCEMFRVLRRGGKLFITAPMAQNEHQTPYDFFRYTSYGLRSLCSQAGFRAVEIKPFGGLLVRWAYEIPRVLALFPSAGIRSGQLNVIGVLLLPAKILLHAFIRVSQLALIWLDRFDRKRNDPWGWECIASK